MRINYNLKGNDRKRLVGAVSTRLSQPLKYLGAPGFQYQIGGYTIDRDGTLTGPDDRELVAALREAGFVAVSEEYDQPEQCQEILDVPAYEPNAAIPDAIAIELPIGNTNPDILTALIHSKVSLITAALGTDGVGALPIEFDAPKGTVKFAWLRYGVDGSIIEAWSRFLTAALEHSKTLHRITARDKAATNEKFAFRVFMVKLGMNDAGNKTYRRLLLRNLTGDSAFATPESRARWRLKHGSKKTTVTEVADDDISE